VAALCRRLDGLPLAVELAAARVRVMSVPEIARRLADRFALLRGGPRDAPARHRTLQAVVEWSWHLLDPAGRAAVRVLSVFPGGCTAEAAGWLLGPDSPDSPDSLGLLEHLVEQSLLQVVDTPAGTRFRMLETVREFGTAQREAAGETDRVVDRFLDWARDFGLANHEAPFGVDPAPALARIRAEQDNLSQALRYGLARVDGDTVAATAAALAALWTLESNFQPVATLGEQTAWVLSHYRPPAEYVEVTRTFAAMHTAYLFIMYGPRAHRSLVVLRRLPPAVPDTLARAAAVVLAAAPEGPAGLVALCGSDQPVLAGLANGVASYLWESAGDPDAALAAAKRMVEVVADRPQPLLRMLAHSRLAELHLQTDHGAEALPHLNVALQLQDGLGDWPEIGIRWALGLASLQVGALDEAERWMALAGARVAEETFMSRSVDLAFRGELLLARGETEAGLLVWRRGVELLATGIPDDYAEPGTEPWTLELKAVAVVAHAQHGRLDLVGKTAGELSGALSGLLTGSEAGRPAYLTGLPLSGALLLALAMTDLDRGRRTGDPRARRSGARLVALAERLRYTRQFQPTMSAARARQAAEQADRSAYAEAVSAYADLSREQLPAAVSAALRDRPP
jgi:hypothetical protein